MGCGLRGRRLLKRVVFRDGGSYSRITDSAVVMEDCVGVRIGLAWECGFLTGKDGYRSAGVFGF